MSPQQFPRDVEQLGSAPNRTPINPYYKESNLSDFFVSKALGGNYSTTIADQRLGSFGKEDAPEGQRLGSPDSRKMSTRFLTDVKQLAGGTRQAEESSSSNLNNANKVLARNNAVSDMVTGQTLHSSKALKKKDTPENEYATKSTPAATHSPAVPLLPRPPIEVSASKIPSVALMNPSPEDTDDKLLCCGLTLTMSMPNDTGEVDLSTLDRLKLTLVILFDTLPRYLYDNLLLHIPALYSYRVSRIIHDAKLALPEVERLYHSRNSSQGTDRNLNMTTTLPKSSLSVGEFKYIWVEFIDSLIGEWNTLNIVSVLLFSALLTLLQIDGAGNDPVTRSMGLVALVCALWSLIFGCIYVIRFGTMKHTHQALTWTEDAQKTKMSIWWNVWILLAMPAVWLAWSLILFSGCILSFTWRTGSIQSPPSTGSFTALATGSALAVRVVITVVFGLGMMYFVLIINTLRGYGARMDEKWMAKVTGWKAV